MARQTFFSFRYKKDNWRASIVRQSWVTKDSAGFFDSAEWEEVKKKTDDKIRDWIDDQLKGTSVTVVLIGSDTAGKKWIKYEIQSSYKKGNGILGVRIHKIKNNLGNTDVKGENPFINASLQNAGVPSDFPIYDWVADDGYKNLGDWVEAAAKAAGK